MNKLMEIYEKSQKDMFFKELNFNANLTKKQQVALFYPEMILSYAEYMNYPEKDAEELALLSQLLYYSVEIHENIVKNHKDLNLVILQGDHLYSKVFKRITESVHLNNISKFTEYIRTFSEKRIMCIDGILSENNATNYKYKEIAKIVTEIVGKDNQSLLDLSDKLSDLYINYLKDETVFKKNKDQFLDKIDHKELKALSEKIIKSMEGVIIE